MKDKKELLIDQLKKLEEMHEVADKLIADMEKVGLIDVNGRLFEDIHKTLETARSMIPENGGSDDWFYYYHYDAILAKSVTMDGKNYPLNSIEDLAEFLMASDQGK